MISQAELDQHFETIDGRLDTIASCERDLDVMLSVESHSRPVPIISPHVKCCQTEGTRAAGGPTFWDLVSQIFRSGCCRHLWSSVGVRDGSRACWGGLVRNLIPTNSIGLTTTYHARQSQDHDRQRSTINLLL